MTFENENENLIRKTYRDMMARELSRSEIQADKKNLAAFFSAPAAAPVFSAAAPAFLIPVFVIAAFFILFYQIQTRHPAVKGPSAPIYRMFAAFMEESQALEAVQKAASEKALASKRTAANLIDDPVRNHMKPRVVVKRIASHVGPTLVYQKVYRETPVTIVWVFTHGGH